MRVYIIADMEGATGVVHRADLGEAGTHHYHRACRWLTGDVNAAVQGAVSEGATEVVVSEGHAHMRNIRLDELHEAARLVRGPARWESRPLCQAAGLDASFALAFFVGFHTKAGTPRGLLSHTWAGAIVQSIHLNGREVGETAINAALCGHYGVPVGLVTGADDVVREARADLGDVEVACVKDAMGFDVASCLPPKRTHRLIADAAGRAVARAKSGAFSPQTLPSPVVAALRVHRREMADKMSLVPGLERVGPVALRVEAPDAMTAISTLWRAITEAFREPAAWLR